jgi:CTP synthase
VLGLKGANSTEFAADSPHPVICMLEDQRRIADKGGTMRLGAQPCVLDESSHAYEAYQSAMVSERHRHRYEFNPEYRRAFAEAGLVASGVSPDGKLVEAIEVKDHPWFVAVQFHPEFKSKPHEPHPLFRSFIEAALVYQSQKVQVPV